jgi:hypothetical protein
MGFTPRQPTRGLIPVVASARIYPLHAMSGPCAVEIVGEGQVEDGGEGCPLNTSTRLNAAVGIPSR